MTTRTAALDSARLPAGWARFARPARDGAFLAGIVFAVMIGLGLLPFAVDAHAYWAADPLDPYSNAALSDFDAYFYSPAFTQAIWPLHWLPWPAFAAIWVFAIVVAFRWLSGLWLGLVMLLPPVFIEVAMGNIHAFIAVAIVLGFRWPVTWAFVLLTKVTPGVGLLWFAARREWRNLGLALGATAAVVAVSYAIAPALWGEWLTVLAGRSTAANTSGIYGAIPLLLRLPVAAVLVVWAARTDRAWVVPIAAVVAMPVVWPNAYAVAVGAIPLLVLAERSRSTEPAGA
ncbi:MAG TPA: glycosyltransferase 87 family protein [Candidatus Limnocylindrales bacterium]|nr:glycosyltransferase 87 family protein [Candidatus Limnocylindrales bacterium]